MDMEVVALSAPIFMAIFQALKVPIRGYTLPKEYYIFVMLILGPVIGILLGTLINDSSVSWQTNALNGLIGGLSASGLWSGVSSAVTSKSQNQDLRIAPPNVTDDDIERFVTAIDDYFARQSLKDQQANNIRLPTEGTNTVQGEKHRIVVHTTSGRGN